MGEVYRAHDSRLDRDVALKILPPEVAADESRRRRFEFEARSASALNHPNIVAIYDIGSEGDLFYIVSELVNGESLRTSLEHGPLPIRRVSDIGAQVAEGLAASHSAGILHRDLKPENVMLTKDGRAKILDFGLAKQVSSAAVAAGPLATITVAEHLVGTPGYMSPEQITQQPVDARSDIFSFGCVLYEMATGRRAFTGATSVEVMHATVTGEPAPLSSAERVLSPALERIVHRCLEKDPSRRFQTAADLAFALQSFTDTSSSGLRPQLATPAAPRRNLIWSIAAIAVILASAAYFASPRLGKSAPPVFKRLTFRLGWISSVVMSPDGRTVVYQAKWEDTPARFYLLTVGQREARDLDLGPAVKLFALSSKGDLAIGMGPGGRTLARVPVSGGPAREILNDVLAADWLPGSESLAVMRRVGKKDRVEFPVGKVLFETDISDFHYNPIRFSPDGRRIAFVHNVLQAKLAVVDLEGNVHQLGPLAPNGGWSPGPISWSPDGKEIWLRSYHGEELGLMIAIDMAGRSRSLARLPGNADLAAVSHDGKALIEMNKEHGGVLALGPGQPQERDLSWAEDNGYPRISADGRWVVFSAGSEGGGATGSVILRKTDGSPGIRLADGVAMGGISPDGKWVNIRPGGNPDKEVLIPTGPGEETEIKLPGIGSATIMYWLPDGKSYVVDGNASGKPDRYWYWQPSSQTMRLLSDEFENARPSALKPDGTEMVLLFDDGYRSVSLPGGESKPFLGFEEGDRAMTWSADGRYIYFQPRSNSEATTFQVWRLEVATRKRNFWKQIAPSKNVDRISGLHITPNGCCYVYSYDRNFSDLYLVDGLR